VRLHKKYCLNIWLNTPLEVILLVFITNKSFISDGDLFCITLYQVNGNHVAPPGWQSDLFLFSSASFKLSHILIFTYYWMIQTQYCVGKYCYLTPPQVLPQQTVCQFNESLTHYELISVRFKEITKVFVLHTFLVQVQNYALSSARYFGLITMAYGGILLWITNRTAKL